MFRNRGQVHEIAFQYLSQKKNYSQKCVRGASFLYTPGCARVK